MGILDIFKKQKINIKTNKQQLNSIKDELLSSILTEYTNLDDKVQKIRERTLSNVDAYVRLSAEQYGVKLGGAKGGVKITSEDKLTNIVVQIQDRVVFNENLLTAQQLIKETFEELLKGSNEDVKKIVDKAFEVDGNGNVSTSKVLGLRTINITNEKWNKAMSIIADSIVIDSSKRYLRVYKRKSINDGWEQVKLGG